MNAVLSKPGAAVPLETMCTVFAEVTSILNSRPISPASDDPSDMEPLTPNHLLLQRRNLAMPPGVFAKEELYSRKQWRHTQFLANCFWSRWVLEYAPTLQQRHKWLLNKRNLAVNDLVLVVDKTVPRSRWLLGCVTKVFPGEDSRVRTAEVKTRSLVHLEFHVLRNIIVPFVLLWPSDCFSLLPLQDCETTDFLCFFQLWDYFLLVSIFRSLLFVIRIICSEPILKYPYDLPVKRTIHV